MTEYSARRRQILHIVAGTCLTPIWVACGGGGVEGGGTGASPQAYTEGSIAGFGSIVVNGVHYDERAATIVDDAGLPLTAEQLKLGMLVRIDSSALDTTAMTATATRVEVASSLLGPVSASDLTAGTLTVLGQTVSISAATVFDERLSGGQSAVAVGSQVEVYAILDPVTGAYLARRIEPRSGLSAFKIRGIVHALDTSARSFQIGNENFSYTSAPAGLAEGALLKLDLATSRDLAGRWQVSGGIASLRLPASGLKVEIEGVIASYASQASFSVAGLTVDASQAQIEPSGASLAAGVQVEIKGQMNGTVLVASRLEVQTSGDGGGSGGSPGDGGGRQFEIKGAIGSVDLLAKTLVVRGITISFAGDVSYSDGSEASLLVGAQVEIKGVLSSDGTQVIAQEIKFDR